MHDAKQWFYGICGFVYSWHMAITITKGWETFAYAAIGAFGAWTGTKLLRLIDKSWKDSWKPMFKAWRAARKRRG